MVDLTSTVDALHELERLTVLEGLGVMNSRSERELDAIVQLAARVAGTKSAGVSLVDERRQLFKARHDIAFPETPREMSFCAYAMMGSALLVVPDASVDPRFADNPLVTCEGGIRFYAGFPLILESGHCVGALCVFDPATRGGLDEQQIALLTDLADIVTDLLETSRFRQLGEIAAKVLDTSSDAALCVNEEGLITFWSRAAETMFGHAAKAALGQSLDLILPKSLAARHHAGFVRAIKGGATRLVGSSVELTAMRADGSEFPIELSLARWGQGHDSGFAALIRDISKRKALERERQQAQALLDAVVANLPAMLFVKDAGTREYLLVNRAGEKLIGRSAADIVGRTDRQLFPNYGDDYEQRDTDAINSPLPKSFESKFVRDDGTPVFLRTKRVIIDGPDRPKQYVLGMSEDMTAVRKAEAELHQLAHFDTLTGLVNRSNFVDRLHRLVAAQAPMALLGIDLDRFKAVNDQFGHLAGDEVLAQVGARLRDIAGPNDIVARSGGDEFAMVLIGKDPKARAERVAQAIVQSVAKPFVVGRVAAHLGASVGIVFGPEDAETTHELRQCADFALYRAKSQGRGRICTYDAAMDREARDRQSLETELRKAIQSDAIDLLYQPVMAAGTGRISSVEALARWTLPGRGPVRPDIFIPLAEESGLIDALGERLLRRACADALLWRDDIRVAVNLSPLQFHGGHLHETVRSVLDATGLPPHRLQLEVTEGLVIRDVERTFHELERLRALGIQILMDDFGVGYSSLSYFKRFKFDKVKIDKSFVDNVATCRASRSIIKAVVGLSEEMEMGVVAEGVETEEQMQALLELGCTHLQGYIFSKAVPAALVTAMAGTAGIQGEIAHSAIHSNSSIPKQGASGLATNVVRLGT